MCTTLQLRSASRHVVDSSRLRPETQFRPAVLFVGLRSSRCTAQCNVLPSGIAVTCRRLWAILAGRSDTVAIVFQDKADVTVRLTQLVHRSENKNISMDVRN